MSDTKKLEKEYALATELSKRVEKLRQKLPEYFNDRRKIFDVIEELEKQFASHLKEEAKFLESLPSKVQARLEKDKAVLALRKQILEMLKPSE